MNLVDKILKEGVFKQKFYHTSGTKFKVGDMIGGPGKYLFMSNSPIPHYTIHGIVKGKFSSYEAYYKESSKKWADYCDKKEAAKTKEEMQAVPHPVIKNPKPVNIFVYEVKPHGKIIFNKANDEWISSQSFVEVVRIVGNAVGILDNYLRKFPPNKWGAFSGAKAFKFKK